MSRRQDLPTLLFRAGTVYVTRTDVIIESKSFYGDDVRAIHVDERRALSIDTELHYLTARALLATEMKGHRE